MADMNIKSLCVKLNYKFRNIVLLHEALTQSFEESEENKYFSPFPGVLYKQKSFGRLHTVGARVVELLIVEQAVNQLANEELTSVATTQDEKKVTDKLWSLKADLQNPKYFEIVGEQLSLTEYIKTTEEFKGKVEAFYEPVIKSILGAIFIDSGGCYGRLGRKGNPLRETRNVFLNLWGVTEFDGRDTRQLLEEEIALNPFSSKGLKFDGLWERMSISDYSRILAYDSKLGYKFQQKWLLRQALTVQNQDNEGELEILKLLGDKVWELVICEYFYWFYINDDRQTHFNDEVIRLFCKEEFQEAVAEGINLIGDLMPEEVEEIPELHIYLKSLIGAIYVDSGSSLTDTKKSIVHLCEKNRNQIASESLQTPLPHSTKTYRGTYYHALDKYCCLVNHGPPKRQEAFKITNVSEFMKVIDNGEYEVKADHVDEMAVAKEEEELDYKRILTCSEDRCNQMEFERLSLYHTLDRMRSDFIYPNGDIVKTEHSYGKCLCNGDIVTRDCIENPEKIPPYLLTKEYGVVSNAQVLEALEIVFVWIMMWLSTTYNKFRANEWRLVHNVIYWALFAVGAYFLLKKTIIETVWIRAAMINETQNR